SAHSQGACSQGGLSQGQSEGQYSEDDGTSVSLSINTQEVLASPHSRTLDPVSFERKVLSTVEEQTECTSSAMSKLSSNRFASGGHGMIFIFVHSGGQKAASDAAKSVGSVSPSKLSVALPARTFASGYGSGLGSGSYTGSSSDVGGSSSVASPFARPRVGLGFETLFPPSFCSMSPFRPSSIAYQERRIWALEALSLGRIAVEPGLRCTEARKRIGVMARARLDGARRLEVEPLRHTEARLPTVELPTLTAAKLPELALAKPIAARPQGAMLILVEVAEARRTGAKPPIVVEETYCSDGGSEVESKAYQSKGHDSQTYRSEGGSQTYRSEGGSQSYHSNGGSQAYHSGGGSQTYHSGAGSQTYCSNHESNTGLSVPPSETTRSAGSETTRSQTYCNDSGSDTYCTETGTYQAPSEALTARSATEMYRSQSRSQSHPHSVASGTYAAGSDTYCSEGSYRSKSNTYQTHDSDTCSTYHAGSGSEGGISGFASQLYPHESDAEIKACLAKDAQKARIVKVIHKGHVVKAGLSVPIVKVILRVHTARVALGPCSAKVIPRAAIVKAGPRATTAKDALGAATLKVRLLQAPTSMGHPHTKIHKCILPPTLNPPPVSLAPENTAKAPKPTLKKKPRHTLGDCAPLPQVPSYSTWCAYSYHSQTCEFRLPGLWGSFQGDYFQS
ncbi:hypothetical protein FRC11_007324, partial [Ceratobasidium sp. 423]